jgi:hypothetical protein
METRASSLAREGPHGSDGSDATETNLAGLCGLHGHCLAHDGAAASNGLQVGHAAAAGRGGMTSRRRECSEGGRRRLHQEGAHGLGLTKDCVHDCGFRFEQCRLGFGGLVEGSSWRYWRGFGCWGEEWREGKVRCEKCSAGKSSKNLDDLRF